MNLLNFLFMVVIAHVNSININNTVIKKNETNQNATLSINSRFFDLGGIINQLFPDFNQGIQQGPLGNPTGMDFPANSQFHPAVAIQGQTPQEPGLASFWPILDDAKHYPNQGYQMQYPNQETFGPQQNQYSGGQQQMQNPNQGNFGGIPQTQDQGIFGGVQYPQQGNFGGNYQDVSQQMQCPGNGYIGNPQQQQYPNFGGTQVTQFPNQNYFGPGNQDPSQQIQYPGNGYPNPSIFNGLPQTQYPDQGNIGINYPNFGGIPQDPGIYGGAQMTQYPNQRNFGGRRQAGVANENNFGSMPPQQIPSQMMQYPGNLYTASPQQPQHSDQGNLDGAPEMRYPNQGNIGNPQMHYPTQDNFNGVPQSQGENNYEAPQSNQYFNQGNYDGLYQNNENNSEPGSNTDVLFGMSATEKRNISNNHDDSDQKKTAILGSPVLVPSTNASESQIVFPNSPVVTPSQRQCVQDCETTTEYNPVCGTDNVTYYNPERFVCARNCGIKVYVLKQGRCRRDISLLQKVSTSTVNT